MNKYLDELIKKSVEVKYNLSQDNVFIVGAYTETLEKQLILVKCIQKLKEFGSTIILCSHFDVDDKIKSLVDYYIYDEKNELLYFDDIKRLNLNSLRFVETDSYSVNSYVDFHHDYAVLTNIRNGINLSLKLNKKIIHYIEYDNIVDTFQYYQTFLFEMNNSDAVIYEYDKGSINNNYCAAYLFSISCDIAEKMLRDVGTLEEHFIKNDWRLENYILNSIKKYTNNIKITKYIDNNKTLNVCYLWNRVFLNDLVFYLVVDDNKKMYFSFHSKNENLIELKYNNYSRFVKVFGYQLIDIGEYVEDSVVYLKYMGKTFFEKKLSESFEVYKKKNFIVFK